MAYARPWLKQLSLSIGLAIVFIAAFVYFTAPPCAFGAAECPVGSTSVFSENVGIQGGTTFTTTLDSTPTVDGVYTIPDSAGNDTFGLLDTAGDWSAIQTFSAPVYFTGSDTALRRSDPAEMELRDLTAASTADPSFVITRTDNGNAQQTMSISSGLISVGGGFDLVLERGGGNQVVIGTSTVDFNTSVIHDIGDVRIGTSSSLSGDAGIIFADGTAYSSMPSNTAGIYADDVAGTVEIFVIDEANSATQISPHPSLFLSTLGIDCDLPWAFESSNSYIGKKISVDLCGAIQAIEVLTGQTFITVVDLPEEDKKDWDTEQTIKFDKCIEDGGVAEVDCKKEEPPLWMTLRGVPGLK